MKLMSFLRSYLMVRRLSTYYKRSSFEFAQGLMLSEVLRRHTKSLAVFRDDPKVDPNDLSSFPYCEKKILNTRFNDYNIHGVSLSDAAAANAGPGVMRIGRKKIFCGSSTGTSGNKGYYLIDEKERFAWLGAILAKIMPDFWKSSKKIAVVLPRNTPLYTGANRTLFLSLRFFNTANDPVSLARDVSDFNPDIIIAAPRLARVIGILAPKLDPERVIVGSEVCDPMDRMKLEARFKRVEEIYMATEGLMATTCPHGSLHLCEDLMHFELEPVHGSNLVSPVITDLHRRTQAMVRYRMNDLLEMGEPCSCGSVHRTVKAVVGRSDDCFIFESLYSGHCLVTPDRLRDAILESDPRIEDFTLEQLPDGSCMLTMAEKDQALLPAALGALESLIDRIGAAGSIASRHIPDHEMATLLTGPDKLRRIRRYS
jgi:putative adenylate-forming enzyme